MTASEIYSDFYVLQQFHVHRQLGTSQAGRDDNLCEAVAAALPPVRFRGTLVHRARIIGELSPCPLVLAADEINFMLVIIFQIFSRGYVRI